MDDDNVDDAGKDPNDDESNATFKDEPPTVPGTGAMKLFVTTPGGTDDAADAVAIGAGAEAATKDLIAGYNLDMTEEDAMKLCLQVLANVSEESQLKPENIEVARIDRDGPYIYNEEEIEALLADVISRRKDSA
jgi:20S proteasome alpha/beta subunit